MSHLFAEFVGTGSASVPSVIEVQMETSIYGAMRSDG
jgi:phosphoglycerol transferase MdoB-like AlkP superfamily enzyme